MATKVGRYDELDKEDRQLEREHLIAQIIDNENFEQLSDIDKLYETLNLARDFEMLESEGFSIRQYIEMQERLVYYVLSNRQTKECQSINNNQTLFCSRYLTLQKYDKIANWQNKIAQNTIYINKIR